jgi:hypothetical protein
MSDHEEERGGGGQGKARCHSILSKKRGQENFKLMKPAKRRHVSQW